MPVRRVPDPPPNPTADSPAEVPDFTPESTDVASVELVREATKAGGAHVYTWPVPTLYPSVPLTAHPAEGTRPATVFVWLDGPPDDRWARTSAAPNQGPDNDPSLTPATEKEGER